MAVAEETAKIVLPFVVGITIIDSFDKLKALAWVIMLSQGYVAYRIEHGVFRRLSTGCRTSALAAWTTIAMRLRWFAVPASRFSLVLPRLDGAAGWLSLPRC